MTSRPALTKRGTTSGVSATRASPGATSFRTATRTGTGIGTSRTGRDYTLDARRPTARVVPNSGPEGDVPGSPGDILINRGPVPAPDGGDAAAGATARVAGPDHPGRRAGGARGSPGRVGPSRHHQSALQPPDRLPDLRGRPPARRVPALVEGGLGDPAPGPRPRGPVRAQRGPDLDQGLPSPAPRPRPGSPGP